MRQFPMLVLLLLGGCGGGVSELIARPTGKQFSTPIATPISAAPTFFCSVSSRSNPYSNAVKFDEEIWMPAPGERSITMGAFRFRILYSNDQYEGASFITFVYSSAAGKLLDQTLFQFNQKAGAVDLFNRGGDFTGFREVHDPDSAAEFHYWCRSV